MQQVFEFVSNNLLLFAALLVVLVMLIKAEYEHQTSKTDRLSASQATRMLNNHDNALVLDIRTQDAFNKGHIRGAQNIPLAELKKSLDKLEKYKSKPVLLYCNSGTTTTKAGKLLQSGGFSDVYHLDGGINAWKEASLPLSKDTTKGKTKK